MTMKKTLIASAVMASIFIAPAAFAFKEYPAGEPVTMNEMELAAVYLQPIDMERAAWAYRQQKPMFTLKRISTL
ncbi:Fe2+ transport protein (plasmid) [Escherichia coli]|nr:Fe2+ transport protein [Escherichia coli]